jgi:hypothetical protein
MIHIGGMVGGGVSQSYSKTLNFEFDFIKRFRNDRDRRDFIAMGTNCAVCRFQCVLQSHLRGVILIACCTSFWPPGGIVFFQARHAVLLRPLVHL